MTSYPVAAWVAGAAPPGGAAERSPDLVLLAGVKIDGGADLAPQAVVLVRVSKTSARMLPQAHFYGLSAVGRVVLPSGRLMTAADVTAVRGRVLRNLQLLLCQPDGAPLPAALPEWGATGVTVHAPVHPELFRAVSPGRQLHLAPAPPGADRFAAITETERAARADGVTIEVLAVHPVLTMASGKRRAHVVHGMLLAQQVAATPHCREVGRPVPPELARGRPDARPPGIARGELLVLPVHPLKAGHDFDLAGVGPVRALRADSRRPGSGRWWVSRLMEQPARGSLRPPRAR